MKRVLAVGAFGALVLLSGCGAGAGGQYLDVVTVELPDGGHVVCVSQEHGLDCDWGNQ